MEIKIKIDLLNKKFGKLTVLSRATDRNNKSYWNCKCDCGKETINQGEGLRDGRITSCGCSREFPYINKNRKIQLFKDLYYQGVLQRNKKKGFSEIIPFKNFVEISKSNYFYCGSEPQILREDRRRKKPYKKISEEAIFHNGIDRIDSLKGYTKSNCRPCCTNCNYAKAALNEIEFANHIKKIYANFASKI